LFKGHRTGFYLFALHQSRQRAHNQREKPFPFSVITHFMCVGGRILRRLSGIRAMNIVQVRLNGRLLFRRGLDVRAE
jgi:hypothetical protein